MLVDKNSQTHLYIQIADNIRASIENGNFAAGSVLPTELELCTLYGVSRYPLRQAMSLLVKEGYLSRTKGKGTFVCDLSKKQYDREYASERSQMIALIIPGIKDEYAMDILSGFENASSELGYATLFSTSKTPELELECIEMVSRCGAAGIVLFPFHDSFVNEEVLRQLTAEGIYTSIIDRNPGLDHVDYIGSDNSGGGYLAARHMKLNGFKHAVFVGDDIHVSSVSERLSGFKRGLKQYGIGLLNEIVEQREDENSPGTVKFSLDGFVRHLPRYREWLPFAVFAENDFTAISIIDILNEKGLVVGREVGVVGFDNLLRSKYITPALTTVAQNGLLIGETAATLAIQKIESGSKQSVRHILPTQLIARKSCGEEPAK